MEWYAKIFLNSFDRHRNHARHERNYLKYEIEGGKSKESSPS